MGVMLGVRRMDVSAEPAGGSRPDPDRRFVVEGAVTVTGTGETTVLVAGSTLVYHDLTLIFCSNTSATGVRMDFRDDTGGTVRFSLSLPAGDIRGVAPRIPIKQTTSGKNWTIKASASVTDVRCFIQAENNLTPQP